MSEKMYYLKDVVVLRSLIVIYQLAIAHLRYSLMNGTYGSSSELLAGRQDINHSFIRELGKSGRMLCVPVTSIRMRST